MNRRARSLSLRWTMRSGAILRKSVRAFALAAAIAMASSSPSRAQPHDDDAPRLQEVVVLVSRLAPLEVAFAEVLRWQVLFRGDLRAGETAGWNLPIGTRGRQLLMGSPGSDYGRIRFVELRTAHAGPMRPAPRWWDTGGAYSTNVFVRDAQAVLDGLRARGWTTSLPMQSYEERAGDRIVARPLRASDRAR